MTSNTARAGVCVLSLVLATACSEEAASDPRDGAPRPTPSSSPDAGTEAGTTPAKHSASSALMRCAVGRREPTSITDMIERINALAPADGPCIVAMLPRPLDLVATTAAVSAQPANGEESPRILFLLPKLVVTVVPSGPGSEVIEFGEWSTTSRTVKGEIAVPVASPLATDAAFTRILNAQGTGTVCGPCHREERAGSIAKSFVSAAFQPLTEKVVPVARLSALHDTCTQTNDPSERCAMLHAVFDVGPVRDGAFDSDVGTFP